MFEMDQTGSVYVNLNKANGPLAKSVYAVVTVVVDKGGTITTPFSKSTSVFTITTDCSANVFGCFTSTNPQVGFLGDPAIFYQIKACTYTICELTYKQSTTTSSSGPRASGLNLNPAFNTATGNLEFHASSPWTKGSYPFYIHFNDGYHYLYLTSMKNFDI